MNMQVTDHEIHAITGLQPSLHHKNNPTNHMISPGHSPVGRS